MKFEGRWFYCTLCEEVAISCPHCGFSSCSGCGCDKCQDDFIEVSYLIAAGQAPSKNDVPIHDNKGEIDRLLNGQD
jgi:hypothetical protein